MNILKHYKRFIYLVIPPKLEMDEEEQDYLQELTNITRKIDTTQLLADVCLRKSLLYKTNENKERNLLNTQLPEYNKYILEMRHRQIHRPRARQNTDASIRRRYKTLGDKRFVRYYTIDNFDKDGMFNLSEFGRKFGCSFFCGLQTSKQVSFKVELRIGNDISHSPLISIDTPINELLKFIFHTQKPDTDIFIFQCLEECFIDTLDYSEDIYLRFLTEEEMPTIYIRTLMQGDKLYRSAFRKFAPSNQFCITEEIYESYRCFLTPSAQTEKGILEYDFEWRNINSGLIFGLCMKFGMADLFDYVSAINLCFIDQSDNDFYINYYSNRIQKIGNNLYVLFLPDTDDDFIKREMCHGINLKQIKNIQAQFVLRNGVDITDTSIKGRVCEVEIGGLQYKLINYYPNIAEIQIDTF